MDVSLRGPRAWGPGWGLGGIGAASAEPAGMGSRASGCSCTYLPSSLEQRSVLAHFHGPAPSDHACGSVWVRWVPFLSPRSLLAVSSASSPSSNEKKCPLPNSKFVKSDVLWVSSVSPAHAVAGLFPCSTGMSPLALLSQLPASWDPGRSPTPSRPPRPAPRPLLSSPRGPPPSPINPTFLAAS